GRFRDDFIDYAAAAVEWSVVGTPKRKIRRPFDILIHRAARQCGDGCPDRGRDHLVAFGDLRVERAAAIKLGRAADIDRGAGGWRGADNRALGRWHHDILPGLGRIIHTVGIVVRVPRDG